MGVQIPEVARRIIEGPVIAHLCTLMRDGSPQVTPVWVDCEGNMVLVNTEESRQKARNLRRDPRVALSILDPDNPNGRVVIRGRVVQMTKQGAREHIDKLSRKYRGVPYAGRPSEGRLIVRIEPEHLTVSSRWA